MENNHLQIIETEGSAMLFISVLRNKGLISWHSAFPVRIPDGYDNTYPPFLQWRFVESVVDEGNLIEIIKAYTTESKWELRKTVNGKWRMTLIQVWEEFDKDERLTPVQASGVVRDLQPEIGKLANAELIEMAGYISSTL